MQKFGAKNLSSKSNWLAAALLATSLVFPTSTLAALDASDSGLLSTGQKSGLYTSSPITEFVGTYVIAPILGLVGTIIFVLFVYAGVLWATAQGDDKKVGKAKEIIKNSVMGTVIIVLAYALSATVINALSGGTGAATASSTSSTQAAL